MSSVAVKSVGLLFLFLAVLTTGIVRFADRVSAADVQVAAASASRLLYTAPDNAKPHMTPLPRLAQARCPGGQLVFLSRACGCNGACCLCSRETPYLNHCTCRCEANPSPCARGHSAGNP
jgi:hypothetical protein